MKKRNNWTGKHGPLLIAEVGGNHEGDFAYAKKLIMLAIKSGVDIVKLQLYTGSSLVSPVESRDRFNHFNDIVLGFNNLKQYESSSPYFGAIVGRYGNRISNGKFALNNQAYFLTTNDNENHLHGGFKGFDKVIWEAQIIKHDSILSLELKYLSKDMEEGYPGNLDITVIYTLNNKDQRLYSDHQQVLV